jgi:hypothetical protein
MLQQSTYATKERWPEKSAGVLKPFGRIALIFLDFLVRFASRQNEYRSKSIILKIKFLISIFLLSTSIHTKAKYQARGILEHFYGENYIDCCKLIKQNQGLALSQSLTLSNRLIANQPEQGLFYLYVHFFACPKKQLVPSEAAGNQRKGQFFKVLETKLKLVSTDHFNRNQSHSRLIYSAIP